MRETRIAGISEPRVPRITVQTNEILIARRTTPLGTSTTPAIVDNRVDFLQPLGPYRNRLSPDPTDSAFIPNVLRSAPGHR
jgi:hypothetical protein